jgi:Fe-S cluster biosynthesis and repair protein YggX
MVVFGYAGYWAWRWDERAAVLIAEKRAEITERRERALAKAQGDS